MQVLTTAPHSFGLLSKSDHQKLQQAWQSERYTLFRNAALAVLNAGVLSDDNEALLARYSDFEIHLVPNEGNTSLALINPPSSAFVDGQLITGIQHNLFAALRDLLLTPDDNSPAGASKHPAFDPQSVSAQILSLLQRANALPVRQTIDLIVCWGGHAIASNEFAYAKEVGRQLGLRSFNICTGCGAGAMYAPMKGALIGRHLQQLDTLRFVGVTETSIISAEPPNPLINELVVLPDIEKRLEAFVRMAHGIVIFPGGVGTAEELLYIIGLLMHERNQSQVLPLLLTGPSSSADYFAALDTFIVDALGERCRNYYQIIIDNPVLVAESLLAARANIAQNRQDNGDPLNYNTSLHVPIEFQQPFIPTHSNMANLQLDSQQSPAALAVALRRAFSGIVAGNIKEHAIQAVAQHGPFQLQGDPAIMAKMSAMLQSFVTEGRFKLQSGSYQPCYEINTTRPAPQHEGNA